MRFSCKYIKKVKHNGIFCIFILLCDTNPIKYNTGFGIKMIVKELHGESEEKNMEEY